MVALPNCCGCASLQTGTRIIGALDLVASIILLVFSIPFLAGSTVSEIEIQSEIVDKLSSCMTHLEIIVRDLLVEP